MYGNETPEVPKPTDLPEESENAVEKAINPIVSDLAEQLRAELKKTQPYPAGTIVRWELVTNDGTHLNFAGIFAGGRWHVTGNGNLFPNVVSHQDFLNRITNAGHRVVNLAVATEYERIEL